jgi:hypothetical protein
VCAAYSAAITRKRIRLYGKSCPSDDGTYQALATFAVTFSVHIFSIFRDMCRLVFVNDFAVLIFSECRQQEEFRFCGSDLRALPFRIPQPRTITSEVELLLSLWAGERLHSPYFVVTFSFVLGRGFVFLCVSAVQTCDHAYLWRELPVTASDHYALCIK